MRILLYRDGVLAKPVDERRLLSGEARSGDTDREKNEECTHGSDGCGVSKVVNQSERYDVRHAV
jgi:hypothetical protein